VRTHNPRVENENVNTRPGVVVPVRLIQRVVVLIDPVEVPQIFRDRLLLSLLLQVTVDHQRRYSWWSSDPIDRVHLVLYTEKKGRGTREVQGRKKMSERAMRKKVRKGERSWIPSPSHHTNHCITHPYKAENSSNSDHRRYRNKL
jgi:hypothetical protein